MVAQKAIFFVFKENSTLQSNKVKSATMFVSELPAAKYNHSFP